MKNAYQIYFERNLDNIHPDLHSNLETIDTYGEVVSRNALIQILTFACLATNHQAITVGSEAFKRLPNRTIESHLTEAINETISFSDPWDFGRLLEVLSEAGHHDFRKYVVMGRQSDLAEIREITDCVAGPLMEDQQN
ncbi:MAG TPA: hypothetical protein VK970_14930 [Candidatus Methylacidiphilales bacterium]|nr:hypothetical protein [Candidatus Methylacidiphilales bacterium]